MPLPPEIQKHVLLSPFYYVFMRNAAVRLGNLGLFTSPGSKVKFHSSTFVYMWNQYFQFLLK